MILEYILKTKIVTKRSNHCSVTIKNLLIDFETMSVPKQLSLMSFLVVP